MQLRRWKHLRWSADEIHNRLWLPCIASSVIGEHPHCVGRSTAESSVWFEVVVPLWNEFESDR